MLNRHVTFDEASFLKSTFYQQVERLKTKEYRRVGGWCYSTISNLFSIVRISSDVTMGGDHAAVLDAEQVSKLNCLAIRIKMNP